MIIELRQDILVANQKMVSVVKERLAQEKVLMLNIIGSPGSGKTSLLEATLAGLTERFQVAIIEADVETKRDSERLERFGAPLYHINTGGMCHLESDIILSSLDQMDLASIDVVIIENVGNLICPADFDIGEHAKIAVSSVPEGDDKPSKYPVLFREAEAVVLNKVDLAPYTNFNTENFTTDLRRINGTVPLFELSATGGDGVQAWLDWLVHRIEASQAVDMTAST